MPVEDIADPLFADVPDLWEGCKVVDGMGMRSMYAYLFVFSSGGKEFPIWTETHATNVKVPCYTC